MALVFLSMVRWGGQGRIPYPAPALAALVASLALTAQPGLTQPASGTTTASQAAADYERLTSWRYTSEPVPVPSGGIRWQLDDASWELVSGRIWLSEPDSEGRLTGLVFEGKGRFRMAVPDPLELAQLRRFVEEPTIESVDVTFRSLVLRAAGEVPDGLFPDVRSRAYAVHKLARQRHEHWLKIRRHDVDAQIIAIGRTPGAILFRADFRTDDWGWLTFDYDSRRIEEIRLDKFQTKNSFVEHWLSLDRREDRLPSGRPANDWRPIVDLREVDIRARMTKPGKDPRQGLAKVQPLVGFFRATLRFECLVDGPTVLPLFLHPMAAVLEVRDIDGTALPVLRDHIGGRSGMIDNRVYDASLVVLLDRALRRGETRELTVDYELELAGCAPGRYWYPSMTTPDARLRDSHTARLELVCRDDYSVRAMGVLEDERTEGGTRITRWHIDRPVTMMTFSMAKKVHEKVVEAEGGVPGVTTFGSLDGDLSRSRIERVAGDVEASLRFFFDRWQTELPADRLYATLIPGAHGQAFDGLLHIGDLSAVKGRSGVMERFRAHEVAHQWWGALVGWVGYRDQWLSESLAEYSAMLFVEETQAEGDELFAEMLQVYADELTGSLKTSFSGFTQPGLPLLNRAAARRIGPIGHGYRCATSDAPSAYLSLAYRKGALVLHMLRVLLRDRSGDDRLFDAVLRDFLARHRGSVASTRDFEAAVARQAGGDWSWFFDQWIFRSEIPTYSWRHEVAARTGEAGHTVTLEVRQSDVADGFKMPVPVVAELADGTEERRRVLVEGDESRFELEFETRPRKIELNPDNSVLARMKRHRR